jgi:hypothetical protein
LLGRRLHRQRTENSFRPSGGTGRIQHGRAKRLVGNRRCRISRRRLVEVPKPSAVALAVGNETKLDLRKAPQRCRRYVTVGLRRNQNFGFAVVENVGQLVRRQKRIDAGVIKARACAGATAFDIARIVLHEDGVVIETP